MGGRRFCARLGDAGLQPPSLGLRPPSLFLLIASQTQSCVTLHLAGQDGVQILALLGDRGKSFNFWPQFPLLFIGDIMNTHLIELLSDRLHTEGPQNWQLQVDPKIHTGLQGTRRAKTIPKKTTTKFEDFLPGFSHITKLQLPQQCGCGVRTDVERSGLEQGSETTLTSATGWVLTTGQVHSMRKDGLFNRWHWDNWTSHTKEWSGTPASQN